MKKTLTPRSLTTLLLGALLLTPVVCLKAQDVTIGAFSGADPGEGIDLTTDDGGTFLYAINVGGTAPIEVGELTFTPDNHPDGTGTPGATITAVNHIPQWEGINQFGPGAADMALAEVMHSIRWTPRPDSVVIELTGLTPGTLYKLQLLFAEKCCDRGWDITINGELLADEYSAQQLAPRQDPTMAAFFSYTFVADSDTLTIDQNGADAAFPDGNSILSAVTLEELDALTDDPNLITTTQVEFGQVASAPPTSKSITIRNLGTSQDLTVSDIRFTGSAAANFSVSAVPDPIPAGEMATVEVIFDAMGTAGGFFADMEIESNDPSESVVTIPLSANVVNLNGPTAWYPMDETSLDQGLRDTSGNGRSGQYLVPMGAIDFGQEALAGGTSIAVSGGGYADISGAQFDAFDSFTLSLWVNADATDAPLQTLVGKGDDSAPVFALLVEGNALAWFSGSEMSEFSAPDSIVAGQTHHVAAVYDNSPGARVAKLYVDGVPVATQEDPLELGDSTSFNIKVGAYNGVLPLAGRLDDLQIYTKVLSDDDIAFLHANPGMAVGVGGAIDGDGDSLSDDEEATLGTDPLNPDTDGDGLDDGLEVNTHETDPLVQDSDGDGIYDGTEVARGSDPLDAGDLPDPVLQISTYSGADPGEGLDFEGAFLYAVNVLGSGGMQIGDALFTADTVPGVTIMSDQAAPNWHPNAEFGDSAGDNALETIVESIRWSAAPTDLELTLDDLTVGQRYSLQLIFAEACCDRGFDVIIQDTLEADEFSPGAIHERLVSKGTVATYLFTATSETLSVLLSNDDAAFPDTNPILNAFTLKQLGAEGDSDGDGLLDSWERLHFGDLSETPEGDPDGDTLPNSQEFELQTNPAEADTDGDGLADNDELGAETNPLVADTDADGLSDGDEVNTHGTDPLVPDSDGDLFSDGVEVNFGSDPTDGASTPDQLAVFVGGDEGEGLDLDGSFLYAINLRGPGDLPVRDATFTDDTVAGFTYDQPNEIIDWHAPAYGDTVNDDNLEVVMQSIRWNAGPVAMSLAGLTPGEDYKLQLLFAESCCDRGWDVEIEGELFFDDFNVQQLQGGINNTAQGVALIYEFTATDDTLEINFINDAPMFPDNNPILNGLTLEAVDGMVIVDVDTDGDGVNDDVEAVAGTDPNDPFDYLRVLSTERTAAGVELQWSAVDGKQYTIEYSETLLPASWEPIATGQAGAAGVGTFEDTDATRLARPEGYYRTIVE